MRKNLRYFLILIGMLPLLALAWVVVQLQTSRLHLLGANGRICPCEFGGISRLPDGTYRLAVPDAPGEVIWVEANSLGDEFMFTEAYVLPWFGRTRAEINMDGEALIRP